MIKQQLYFYLLRIVVNICVILGICSGLHLLGLMTFLVAWYIVRKKEKKELAQQEQSVNKVVVR